MPKDRIAKGLLVEGGSSPNPEEPEYQVGEGCMEDQLVGQYLAEIAGLGELVDRKNVRAALASIYKYNYKRSLYNHECTERVYALNDEAGVTICDFPHGKRPEIAGCGVTAHVMLLTDMPIASRAAGIISRMASRWMPM